MVQNRPSARVRAMRALLERATPTIELVADAAAVSSTLLRRRAEREGWALDREPERDLAERLNELMVTVLGQLEAIAARAAATGGRIDKSEIDGPIALLRGAEKLDELMRPGQAANNKKTSRDDDLAEVLDTIHTRILSLAADLAAEMVEAAGRAARRGAAQG